VYAKYAKAQSTQRKSIELGGDCFGLSTLAMTTSLGANAIRPYKCF
jgi:hypothetical protein